MLFGEMKDSKIQEVQKKDLVKVTDMKIIAYFP